MKIQDLIEGCKHGEYYCSTDKKWKCRTGPKQRRKVSEGDLNEFAPGAGDDGGEDPYKYPKPKLYRRSVDFFGQFEADHFDREDMNDATGEFKGYWGKTQIAYFKFDNPAKTGSDDSGMGWYYEPDTDSNDSTTGSTPAVDMSAQRKQQELSMISAFLKSGQTPKPGSQIHSLMKKHGMAEGLEHYNGIEISMEKEDDEINVKAMMAGGRELGHVLFVIDGEYLMPQDLEVDERYQGQGIAATMYDYVKSKGYKIRRSGQQTDAGAGFWDKHKPGKNVWEQGVAEAHPNSKIYDKCWDGYKKVPGKKRGEPGSCVEETYHGDEFFEAYGVLWFNEDEQLDEAKYQGRKVTLGKPMQGDVKKFKVYVKDPSTGNIKKVNFGDPDMKIRKSNPAARRSFRARHNCDNPGPRTKARYWSCRKW